MRWPCCGGATTVRLLRYSVGCANPLDIYRRGSPWPKHHCNVISCFLNGVRLEVAQNKVTRLLRKGCGICVRIPTARLQTAGQGFHQSAGWQSYHRLTVEDPGFPVTCFPLGPSRFTDRTSDADLKHGTDFVLHLSVTPARWPTASWKEVHSREALQSAISVATPCANEFVGASHSFSPLVAGYERKPLSLPTRVGP